MAWSAFDFLEKLWLVMGFFWLLTAFGQKRAVFRESASRSAAFRIGSVVAAILLFSGWLAIGPLGWRVMPEWPSLEWAAVSIGTAGFACAFWARIVLGGEWSSQVTLKADHRLIQTGPYALIRHPIYSGLLFAVLGTAMAGNQVRMYLAVAVLFGALWYKSQLEEQVLIRAMGQRYIEYRQHTYALIPGVL